MFLSYDLKADQKRPSDNPRSKLTLNVGQKEALECLDSFVSGASGPKQFGLFGAAGTGKTSVVAQLFEYTRTNKFDRVVLSAPTHKAVGVLSQAATALPARTIHSLLGCRKQRDDNTGEITYPPDPDRQPIEEFDVVVIDECSMIGDTLYSWIEDAQDRHGFKVIWLGDPYQLAPVNDGDRSPTFDIDTSVTLTQIMRHVGPIQAACNAVREAIQCGNKPPIARPKGGDSSRIRAFRNTRADIDRMFDDYQDNAAESKILAFRNDDVNWCNSYMRARLYGADADPYVSGERLVVSSTSESTSGAILHSGTECEVLDVVRDRYLGLDYWRLYVCTSHTAEHEIRVFGDRAQRHAYKKEESRLRDRAQAGEGWAPFFELKEAFGHVRPGYATTVHKGQGSTFDRVYFMQSEMLGVNDVDLKSRLLYVAYSRARMELVLI